MKLPPWKTRSCLPKGATGSSWTKTGALWVPSGTSAGGGWRFADAKSQIVSYTLGDRSQQSARWLRESIPEDYARRATRSDFWDAYGALFPARTHRFCAKHEGETNHLERFFGTLRARVSRLIRKAYSFSKHPENHLDAIHFFITTYNLGIKQSTLM